MKRLTIKVISCLASFALGVGASSFVNWIKKPVNDQPRANLAVHVVDQPPAAVAPEPEDSPSPEIVFGGGRLRIVSARVQLKDERLRYEIDVTYPQIVGSDDLHIRKLDRRLEELANEQNDWLTPSKADLRYYREMWPDRFNTTDVDYQIISATDSFLSIYFNGYSYGIGAAHSVQYSFVVNYDLALKKEVKLSDIFAPRSKYLEFIAQYCTDELSQKPAYMFKTALGPHPANFKSWNITRNGIRFNFDECSVFSCADGEQEVEIPYAKLKEFLNERALKALGFPGPSTLVARRDCCWSARQSVCRTRSPVFRRINGMEVNEEFRLRDLRSHFRTLKRNHREAILFPSTGSAITADHASRHSE